jgi:hypothetical protein
VVLKVKPVLFTFLFAQTFSIIPAKLHNSFTRVGDGFAAKQETNTIRSLGLEFGFAKQ